MHVLLASLKAWGNRALAVGVQLGCGVAYHNFALHCTWTFTCHTRSHVPFSSSPLRGVTVVTVGFDEGGQAILRERKKLVSDAASVVPSHPGTSAMSVDTWERKGLHSRGDLQLRVEGNSNNKSMESCYACISSLQHHHRQHHVTTFSHMLHSRCGQTHSC